MGVGEDGIAGGGGGFGRWAAGLVGRLSQEKTMIILQDTFVLGCGRGLRTVLSPVTSCKGGMGVVGDTR